MQNETFDPKRQLYMAWEGTGYDLDNVLHARDENGVKHIIYKHATQMTVKVSNGPYSVGRTWYTIDVKDGVEYEYLDVAIAAAFGRLQVFNTAGESHLVKVQWGSDVSVCPLNEKQFIYRGMVCNVFGNGEWMYGIQLLQTDLTLKRLGEKND
jgi:hypothetical protein